MLIADVTDIPDDETTHDESECSVTRDGANMTIKGMTDVGRWWVGSVNGDQVTLTLHQENPDPMVKAMQLRMILEGQIVATDHATGIVKGYAGTNQYITGTWTLMKKNQKASNQASEATSEPAPRTGASSPQG